MRIAYLTQSYPPMISGAALVVEGLATAMAKRGHEVLVIAASETGQAYRVQEGNLTVIRLRSLHNPLRMGQRFLLYPRAAVMHTLRAFAPELIHVHEPVLLGWLSVEYAQRANIPAVLTVHQLPSFVASYLPDLLRAQVITLLWLYARWFARKFSWLITPTQTIGELFMEMTGVPVGAISSGVNLETFHPLSLMEEAICTRRKWKLPLHAPILLHVGRLDVEKRVDRVIRAAAGVLAQTDAHLLIVGDGSEKKNLLRLCDELEIADRVHFTGFVSLREGLPELYRVAHLFVTASEIETQGIVLLEAAASGLPIVAVRATCIPEIVHEGINGFLFEPGDIQETAVAMIFLLKNPGPAEGWGRASRLVAEKHSRVSTLDAHETLYRDVIRRGCMRRVSWSPFRAKA